MTKYICYTLDLEEDHAGYLQNYYEGLDYLEKFIEIAIDKKIKLSFFIQAKIFEEFPEKLELIRQNNFDIHLHSYYHLLKPQININEIRKEVEMCKEIYKNFFNRDPIGYRFPLGVISKNEYMILDDLNFRFDSSIFPTIRIGYFNNLNKPLTPYKKLNILEIPFSVISPVIRIPIALSYIKLFYPLHFLFRFSYTPLIFDFHMHDLFRIKSTNKLSTVNKLPYIRKSQKGLGLFLKFHEMMERDRFKSITITELFERINRRQL